jgi:hypothetical protein
MKRMSKRVIAALCAVASICLLAPAVGNVAPQGQANGLKGLMGGIHLVAGSAYTSFYSPDGEWYIRRQFAAVDTPNGVHGHVRVDYFEEFLGDVFETTFVVSADCLEVDEETGEAWIGGEVVEVTTNFEIPYLGMKMVFYVDDNDGDNLLNPDIHGSAWEIPETCEQRPDPFFPDPSERGKITVK